MKNLLCAELLKIKRSKILWIVILAPLFIVIQGVANFIRYKEIFTNQGQNIWNKLYEQSIIFYCLILLPILITLVVTLISRIENTNSGWKYFLTLPVKRSHVYFSKLIISCGLIFINTLTLSLSMFIAGKIVGAEKVVPYSLIFGKPFLAFLASFPIISILYLISIRFTYSTIALGVGIGLTIPSILVANTKFWIIYPWTYPTIAGLNNMFSDKAKGITIYVLSLVIFLTLSFLGAKKFIKKDII